MTAKFNLLVVAAIPAVAIVPLLACGGSSSKTPDAPGGNIDAPGSGSGSGSGSNVTCALPANVTAFLASSVRYRSGSGSGAGSGLPRANRLSINGYLDAGSAQRISITIYGGCGSTGSNCQQPDPNTPDWPTTFGPKSGLDFTTATDVSAIGLVGSGASASAIYLVSSGTLNVTNAGNGSGAPFAGSVANLVLVHADIGSAGATPDPDGCTTNVSLSFSGNAPFNGKVIVVDDADDDIAALHHRWQ